MDCGGHTRRTFGRLSGSKFEAKEGVCLATLAPKETGNSGNGSHAKRNPGGCDSLSSLLSLSIRIINIIHHCGLSMDYFPPAV